MRLFVAIDIPEEVRGRLAGLVEELRRAVRGPAWARVAGMHLTLKFIGEVEEPKAGGILRALDGAGGFAPFEVHYRGTGFFPDGNAPRVFWAGMVAPPELAALASAVEACLEPLGIARERRAFHPHLTLARLKSRNGLVELHEAAARLRETEFGEGLVEHFHLYRSILKPSGAEYTRMASFGLEGKTGGQG